MATTIVKSRHGHNVTCHCKIEQSDSGPHVVRLRACCGRMVLDHPMTIGAMDGPRPSPLTKEKVKEIINNERQKLADNASWHEHAATALDEFEKEESATEAGMRANIEPHLVHPTAEE